MSKAARYRKKLVRAGVLRGNYYHHKSTNGVFMSRGTDVSVPFGIHFKYYLRKSPLASRSSWRQFCRACKAKYSAKNKSLPSIAGGRNKEYPATVRIPVNVAPTSGLLYSKKSK